MADPIPAITIWQPWATLIAEGAKRFEFRSWAPSERMVGLRIAIHAGARAVRKDELRGLILQLERGEWRWLGIDPAIAWPILQRALPNPRALPLSSVLCTAVLGRAIRNQELAKTLGVDFVNDSDRSEHSNFGWPLSDIQRVEPPAPARGSQGWWNWIPGEHNG